MTMLLDTGEPAGYVPEAQRPRRRRWIVLAVVLALAAGVGAYVVRHRPVTADQFVAFAERLDAFPAPAAGWTAFDPTVSGYASGSTEGWTDSGAVTWTNLGDPSSWVAVHGWQTSVPIADVAATCRAAVAWMTATATSLDLAASDSPATQKRCEAVVGAATVEDASVSDAWASQGLQTTDGAMRYRTGSLVATEQSDPGYVTITVLADATVVRG